MNVRSFAKIFVQTAALAMAAVSVVHAAQAQPARTQQAAHPAVIRLGISNYATPNPNEALYQRTIETLRNLVAPAELSVEYYSPGELSRAVDADALDLVFGSSGFYRRTALKTGNRELVSIATDAYPDPNRTDGAAIVVRGDRADLTDIASLRGKRLAANRPFTFTGFLVPMGAVAEVDDEPEKFFSAIDFKGEGSTMLAIARDVVEGRADVGFLRLCMLETLEDRGLIPKGVLRVVDPKNEAGEPCRRSTDLYPGWTVSTTPKATPALSRNVTVALLSQPAVGAGLRWAIATDYQRVDNLYRKLRMGPYEHLRDWTVERFIVSYWPWLVALLAAVSLLAAWASIESGLLKKALKRQRELEGQAREARNRMDVLQKTRSLGELSSAVAHELRQPLASIVCTAKGLMLFADRGDLAADRAKRALETIGAEAMRASAVVEKVRSYAKMPAGVRETVDLAQCVNRAETNIRTAGLDAAGAVHFQTEPCTVLGDALELELVVVNLVRNALEAAAGVADKRVDVRVKKMDTSVLLEVTDNGPAVSDEVFANLGRPFKTSKSQGLGLGLSIVRSIVEKHGGSIRFARPAAGGLCVRIYLPMETGQEQGEPS